MKSYVNDSSKSYSFNTQFGLFLSGLLSVLYLAFRDEQILYLLLYIVFYIVIFTIMFKHEKGYWSLVSFSVMVTLLPLYQMILYDIHGSYFLLGGDAEFYYKNAISYAVNNDEIAMNRYWLYIYIVGGYFKFINNLGGTASPTYFSLLTMLISSFTVSLYHSAITNIHSKIIANKAIILWIITPFFLYLSIGQLRDIYTYITPAYTFYFLSLHLKNKVRFENIIIVILLIVYAIYIRVDIALYCCVMLLAFHFLYVRTVKQLLPRLTFMVLALFLLINFSSFIVSNESQLSINNLDVQVAIYNMQCIDNCNDSSAIKSLQGTIPGFFILPIISYFTPFPSFLLDSQYNLIKFYEMIFFFLWIALSVFFLLSLKDIFKYRFQLAFAVSLIFLFTLLGITTVGVFRQKIYVYPIIYSYILVYKDIYMSQKFVIRYAAIIALLFSSVILFYFFRLAI